MKAYYCSKFFLNEPTNLKNFSDVGCPIIPSPFLIKC
jgi:hypothetical protein